MGAGAAGAAAVFAGVAASPAGFAGSVWADTVETTARAAHAMLRVAFMSKGAETRRDVSSGQPKKKAASQDAILR